MRASKHDPSRRTFLKGRASGATECSEFHISSLVVHARPHELDAITAAIERIEGAEVYGANERGKLVVTLETESDGAMLDRIASINRIGGVISVAMVFHQVEDE